jgi:hypothetical protein
MSQIKVIAMAAILVVSASSAFASERYHSHSRRIHSEVQLLEGRYSAPWSNYGYSGSTLTGRDAMVNTLSN